MEKMMSQTEGVIASLLALQKQRLQTQKTVRDRSPGQGALAVAFEKSDYKLLTKVVKWPRLKGPVGIRVDCGTGYSVSFVK